jgi:hypothetical protein
MDIAGAPVGQSAGEVAAALTAHTNQTIAGGVHGGLPSYVLTNAAAFDAAGAAATVQTNLGTFATSQTNVNNAVSAALSTFTNNAVTNYNAGGVQLNSNLFVMGRAAIGTNTATQVLDVAGQVSAHDIVNKKGRSVSRIAMDGRVPYVGGRTWQAVNTITNGIWGLCWSSELGVFVGGGTGGQLWISTNGTDWAATTNYSGATANFRTITWSPELGLFVLLPWVTSGSGNYYISRDGINWTASGTTTYTWVNACWSSELRLFVAIAFQSKVVGTSPDGINWTITDISSQAGDASAYGIAWSPELRLFVVTTQGGTSNPVLTSPDGVTWTARTSAGNSTWNSVCWSSELRLFCSVASAGASYRIQTSADGIAWGGVNAPAANSWQGVCWSPEIRLFCAVAGSGTGTRGMTSPDGTNWTIRTSAADNNWRNVVWSPELRRFLAGSSTATTNRVMVSGVEDYARISGLRSPNGYGLDLDGALIVSNGVVSATGNVVVAGTITATGGIYVAGTHVATNIVSADASVTIVRNVGGFDLSVAPSTNSGLTASQVASFMLTNAAGTASALAPGSASNTLAAAITNGGNVALAAVYGSNAVSGAIQTYTATNPTIALSPTNCAIAWIPTESNATMQVTFTIPGAGYAGSGILRLVNTNVNTIIWTNTPNVYWYNNGTRTLSPPTLSIYNRIVVDWFDGMLTLGLVSTNAAPTP